MKNILSFCASWLAFSYILVLRITCRRKIEKDPRPLLRSNGTPYIYAALHAHQISTLLLGEAGVGAMVSRSRDGQVVVPSLRSIGVVVIRGSGRGANGVSKGGKIAIDQMAEHIQQGRPGYVAVDGPRGPRGCVHMGIATLAVRTGAVVLPIAARPKWRLIISSAWDRLQLPLPFSWIHGYCGEPLSIRADETTESFRKRIEESLKALEMRFDPSEGKHAKALRPTPASSRVRNAA